MIVYTKLGNYLKDHNMNWKDLIQSGIAVNTPQKFSHNRNVSIETINKVCEYLKVQPSDIMEWIPDEEYKELQSNIQKQKKEEIEVKITKLEAKLNKL